MSSLTKPLNYFNLYISTTKGRDKMKIAVLSDNPSTGDTFVLYLSGHHQAKRINTWDLMDGRLDPIIEFNSDGVILNVTERTARHLHTLISMFQSQDLLVVYYLSRNDQASYDELVHLGVVDALIITKEELQKDLLVIMRAINHQLGQQGKE